MRLSIVVPTYNSATWIKNYAAELLQLSYDGVESIEIIIADDCSSDNTCQVLEKMADIKLVKAPERQGQHLTTHLGIKASSGDIVVTIDDDGEISPIEIRKLIARHIENPQAVVYGVPDKGRKRSLKIFLYNIYLLVLKINREERKSSFRLISGDILKSLKAAPNKLVNIDIYITSLAPHTAFVSVDYTAGKRGRYTIADYIKFLIQTVLYKRRLKAEA